MAEPEAKTETEAQAGPDITAELEVKTEPEAKKEEKWSKDKFIIGIAKLFVNMSTFAWAMYTVLAFIIILRIIFKAQSDTLIIYLTSPVMIILVSGWVVVSIIMGCNLQKAVAGMIENTKITAEIKAGAQANINADTAKIIEAIKTISNKKEGGN